MKEVVKQNITLIAWGLFVVANALAFWAWSQLGVRFDNPYRLFPLFGLIAFSTMWGHYVVWALREWSGADKEKTQLYSQVTHVVVFIALVLHPILLIYQLRADGFGLPPDSYRAYVGEGLVAWVLVGMAAWIGFLLFEIRKWLQKKETLWKWVMGANHLAMLAVVLHALKLGQSVKQSQLKYIWPLYGITLLGIYYYLWTKKKLV